MKGKAAFVLGAAIGYVFGTRAGRERYEQIKRGAQNVWETAPVQQGVATVRAAVDVRVDELKHAVIDTGAQLLGSLAKRVQGPRETSQPSARKRPTPPKKTASASKSAQTRTSSTAKPAANKSPAAAKNSDAPTTDTEAS